MYNLLFQSQVLVMAIASLVCNFYTGGKLVTSIWISCLMSSNPRLYVISVASLLGEGETINYLNMLSFLFNAHYP